MIIAAELRAMRSWIDYADGTVEDPQPTLVEGLVEAGTPFWLDIEDPTDEVIDRLATRLGLHPLAVEDSKQFGQRASLWIYGDVAMIVAFGLDQDLHELMEVHCYCTRQFLITLHRGPSPAFSDLRRTDALHPVLGDRPIQALHRTITALHAPFREWVLRLDEQLDRLEQSVLRRPTDRELAEVIAVRHRAAEMRHRREPGRDLAARVPLILSLPGATEQDGLYAQDISEELQQVVSDLTRVEERCITVMGLHASLVGNRVAGVSRRLAAVATVFLPVSFLAGYFGQNFNVLTSKIETGWLAFLTLGVALYAVVIVAAILWLRRRGWH